MGTYYWFGCVTDKEFIDFSGAKASEILGNAFDTKLLAHFMMMESLHDGKEFRFLSDESGDWDYVKENKWTEVTCDVLIDMFEDGFIPDGNNFSWIFNKFKEAKRLKELGLWLDEFDKGK